MRIAAPTLWLLLALLSSCTDLKAPPPPSPARVITFTADKTQVAANETVTLTFRTEHATEVQVLDDEGHFIDLTGTAAEGTATVNPSRSTFYIARANGLGGRDAAFVQVTVDEAARDVFLIAVPDEIDPGESAQLLWGASDATTLSLQTGEETPTPLTGTSGTVFVNPPRSERYTLHVNGRAATFTDVRVRPKLNAAQLDAPNGLEPGASVTLRWSSRGAQRITIRELTFGTLIDTTTMLDDGFVTWAVPSTTAPLRFELTASSNAGTDTKHLTAVVGDAPLIERVTAPAAASVDRTFTLSWNTLGAAKVAIEVEGHVVFETSPRERARAEAGSVSLPAPGGPTDYTVIATNDRGVSTRRTITVCTVPLPTITSFTLTPPTLNTPGESVTATWSTANARRIQLRLASGPTIAVNETTPTNGSTTFRAGAANTYELEAWNEAGDRAVATATLALIAAPPVSLSPTPTLVADITELRWNLATLGVTEVVGIATPRPPAFDDSPNFVDLSLDGSAFEFIFANRADGFAELPLPDGFHFMLLGVERPKLWVSVNGFITTEPPNVSSTNVALLTDTVPTMLAPYWDDLTLGPDSKVLAGFAPRTQQGERRFVIQWHRVFANANELTFQVQLTETGAVTFLYETLGALHGDSATIGVKEATQVIVQQVSSAVNERRELNFFNGAPANGTLSFIAQGSQRMSLVGRTATGVMPFQLQLVALKTGDLTINEAMPSPALAVSGTGQWVELRNNTASAIALNDLVLRSTNSTPDGGFTFGNVTIPANGFLVAGQSTDATDNGGANVTVITNDVPLFGGVDEVTLSLGNTVLDTLPWSTTSNGVSVQRTEGVLLGVPQPPLCTHALRTFGPHGAIGTPGIANEDCAPYRVERIAGAYVALGGTGDVELLPSANDYTGFTNVPLSAPFTYFGQPFNSLGLSVAGFFTFGNPLTKAHEAVNDVLPNTTQPNGVVAPFWDRLVRNPEGHLWLRRASDRTIISWQDFRVFGANASGGSKVFFQVHLFDTGVIEFHYGTFDTSAASYVARARGSSATVWLEHPDGGVAVPVGVNVDGTIRENSGVRFTP